MLQYPFDAQTILKKRRSIKKDLLAADVSYIDKNIAVLGGSTTHDILGMLELFLLDQGIRPIFYESEFGQYWQDAMFENSELNDFRPDIIFIHTSNRNILEYPCVKSSGTAIGVMLETQYSYFETMWDQLFNKYHCPIIQNNFEMPFCRLLGNKDVSDIHGRTNYINRLNNLFYGYAQTHTNFYINDINYQSAHFGLEKWSDPLFWYMYKYALCVPAIPYLSFNLSNIIKSILGKNKKALAVDLDNTLWGGVVGDDGAAGIEIGHDTSMGQAFCEFQSYLKSLKDIGVVLTINSKNDLENAMSGLNHPEGVLRADDFILIKANWNNKDQNTKEIAAELNIYPDSLVLIDDNPVEREIVVKQVPGVIAPALDRVEHYIEVINESGLFEVTDISEDDLNRSGMYMENTQRSRLKATFLNYTDYLLSLEMKAEIKQFEPMYMPRIAQLTNKSNQFNLTTRRYLLTEIERIAADANYITLYGKLTDKFGDNGVVSVVIGEISGSELHIRLWLMSCRVLKRNMEHAMMDTLVGICRDKGIKDIRGYYYPTAKNGMVQDFYALQGFEKESEDEAGNTIWHFAVLAKYEMKNCVITVDV